MSNYIDKFILYILGVVIVYANINIPYDIAYLLVGIIILGVTGYERDTTSGIFDKIICAVFMTVSLIQCKIAPFMPIVVYVIFKNYLKELKYVIPFSVMTIGMCIRFYFSGFNNVFFLYGIILVAIVLGIKAALIDKYEKTIIRLRDDSTEKNNLLVEKNKNLATSMDNEIRIATLSERNRIAREIHDNVGHMLSRSILQLGAVMTVNKDAPVYNQLVPLKDSLDTAMNNVRESVHDLHKESFDVKIAAQNIIDELKDFNVKFSCDISGDANKEIKYAFITILKEAITNIEKYCNGDSVTVIISELEEHYQMLIEDNGQVDKYKMNSGEGIGLKNMRERIKNFGGIITFSTEKGFRIFISVPKKVNS